MSVLVIGGTGTVGSAIVHRLVEHGTEVRVLTRSPEFVAARIPAAHYLRGDLTDPGSCAMAFRAVERVYLVTALGPDEVDLGRHAVEAARDAGVSQVVFQSVHRAESGPEVPHFRSKVEVAEILSGSGIPNTLIEPNRFFQNDRGFREPMLRHGLYPQPIGGIGLSAVDLRDVADAAVRVLTEAGHEGKRYALVGSKVLTGEGSARIWSDGLGLEVRYVGDDLDAWADRARRSLPERMVTDLRAMYDLFQRLGLVATAGDLDQTRQLLGREPRTFEAFVAETATAWSH